MEEKIMHLLITEDDMALAQGLQRALQEKNRQVLCCKNIQETRQHLHQNQTDLLILDVNLPDGSGFDLLQEIRRTSDLPVILLTANDLEMDIVSGLEQGANDYITKPFSLAVLRARVNTQLRNRTAQMQKESTQNTQIWEGSIWKFDFTNMRFTVSGQEVELSKTEQKLLALLVQHVGMTVPRETLMDRIWTDGAVYVDENALSVAIKRLRDKTGKGADPDRVWDRICMGSMIGYFVIILLAAGSVLAAAFFFRHRQKQVMDGLSDMLEAAINGTFSETTFDESRQSSLENRLAQYLAASELSVRSIDAERERIKELIADISHQTRTPLSNILLYTELLEEEPLGEAAQDSVKKLRQQSENYSF